MKNEKERSSVILAKIGLYPALQKIPGNMTCSDLRVLDALKLDEDIQVFLSNRIEKTRVSCDEA